jgi:peptidylprolyl isomerase/FKBP-type peptidyl-prolyl cis-trans isomerase FklB
MMPRSMLRTAVTVLASLAITAPAPAWTVKDKPAKLRSSKAKRSTASATAKPPTTKPGPDFLLRNGKARGVVTTKSGLQYFVVKSGPKKGAHPVDGDQVTFDYEGTLTTGEKFDSSFDRGEPITGDVGRFVPGFTEALKLMRPGDDWIVWIPPELGYGPEDTGPIPGNSVLRFRLKLISVGTPPTDRAS